MDLTSEPDTVETGALGPSESLSLARVSGCVGERDVHSPAPSPDPSWKHSIYCAWRDGLPCTCKEWPA